MKLGKKVDVLVVTLRGNVLGDWCRDSQLYQGIRTVFPNVRITLIGSSLAKELYSEGTLVNEVVVLNDLDLFSQPKTRKTKKFFVYLKMLFQLRKFILQHYFDMIFVTTPNLPLTALFCKNAHSVVYGFGFNWFSKKACSGIVDFDHVQHSLSRFWHVNKTKGLETNTHLLWAFNPDIPASKLNIPPRVPYGTNHSLLGEDYIVLQGDANEQQGMRGRSLSVQEQKKVFDIFVQQNKTFVIGSVERLEQLCDAGIPQDCLIHSASLRNLKNVLKNAKLVVGVDSGPLHLAASLGTPTIGLYRTTEARFCRPNKTTILFDLNEKRVEDIQGVARTWKMLHAKILKN